MKILSLHCDYIKFKPLKKALKQPEKLAETGKKEKKINEVLVIFTAVEKQDENNKQIVQQYIDNIKDLANQVKAKSIVLYPYAHLSSQLSSPDFAQKVMQDAEKQLKKSKLKVERAPFGYYKEFELKCKGHPLAELSREITGTGKEGEKSKTGEGESEALKAEKKLKSYWHIMTPDGKLHDMEKFNFKDNINLKKFAFYEKVKSRKVVKEPVHVKLMKKLELVDYEPASDLGNLRYYPKGRLIKGLIEEYVTKRVQEYGGIEVETPIMYDIAHPTLSKYLQRFPARQYQITSDKRNFFLRFSACFGQFLMAKDASISYKDLPLKLYELTRYSFRREQSGELTGLRRLRAFTMPDVHAFCRDEKQAIEEFETRFRLCLDVQEKIGLNINDLEMAIRFTKPFYKKNKKFIEKLAKIWNKPVLIEMWDERFFYFVLKYEFNFVDSVDKAAALSTDQIDVENAERYGIKFTDKDNKKKLPLILHCSPSGAIERIMYALLEKTENKKNPVLPYWLSPTQVRILPLSEKYVNEAEELAKELNEEFNIRTDVDDRDLPLSKKVSDAEKEWIPDIITLGEIELKNQVLAVRIRKTGEIKTMKPHILRDILRKKQGGMPWRPLPLPMLLSKRPKFV